MAGAMVGTNEPAKVQPAYPAASLAVRCRLQFLWSERQKGPIRDVLLVVRIAVSVTGTFSPKGIVFLSAAARPVGFATPSRIKSRQRRRDYSSLNYGRAVGQATICAKATVPVAEQIAALEPGSRSHPSKQVAQPQG